MQYTPKTLGDFIRKTRKTMKISQTDLAMTSGTGQRFISDLENGKATCQIGKVLTVLYTLGIRIDLHSPVDTNDPAE